MLAAAEISQRGYGRDSEERSSAEASAAARAASDSARREAPVPPLP